MGMRYRLRSATPDIVISPQNLNQTIGKYLMKKAVSRPTEWETPIKSIGREIGGDIWESWIEWDEGKRYCTCQIMMTVPFYLLKKLDTYSWKGT